MRLPILKPTCLAEVETTTNYKVRIGAIGAARETETIAVAGSTNYYIVAEEPERDKGIKWMVVTWENGVPTFGKTSEPTTPKTPDYESAVKAVAFKLTSIDENSQVGPDGCVWIVPVVKVEMSKDIYKNSKRTEGVDSGIDIVCGEYTDPMGVGAGVHSTGVYIPVGATITLFGSKTNNALIATNSDEEEVRIGTGTDLTTASGTLTVKEAVTVREKTIMKTLKLVLKYNNNDITGNYQVGAGFSAVPTMNGGTPGTAITPVRFVDEEGRDITGTTTLSEVGKCTIKINIAKDSINDTLVEGAVAVTVVGTSGNIEFGSTENGVVVNEDGSWTISVPFDGGKF